ncbi:OmpA family protein [Chryseolinea sp. Jin1]|uniref:OmpA family protein n=2 Tax=Chryseolinea lacunae TaxID=2801331 RepID=A0ABS1KP50_9BACT|nr:OmpA family protein [Chryseolinea lacunae]MBL0741258.1 OmpA family protein [Chryseolinea lacunae]
MAQKPKKKFKKGGVVQLDDSLTRYSQSDIFLFPNLVKVRYYTDREKLQHIKALAAVGDYEGQYAALKPYVKNFGPDNFSRDTQLLWDLAKLSQRLGPPGEAVLLYKLVLKHLPQTIDGKQVKSEFDTLTRNDKDLYVPLKDYYELVAYRKEIDTLRPPQGVLLNMGEAINSDKEDYGPTIGHVDNMLLFTSKRNKGKDLMNKTYNEDLFYTLKVDDNNWGFAEEFKTINTPYNEGSACLSKDGKQLYFARCNSPDSHGSCDIFMAVLKPDSTFGDVKNLGPNINSISWDSQPSLSHSGDTLFFASDRIGGFGYSDIYFSVKDKTGAWQRAQNLGPIVNTRGFEVSPFFHHAFNVLYFSSNGQPLTFGDFDIYKAQKFSVAWEEPKNIGPLVNGPGSEYYFTIDSESHFLYYARSAADDINNLDLHSFPVPMEAQPNATARLKGSLINSETKKPFKGIVSVIDLDKGVEVAPKFLREDGSFDFNLINKRNYLLIIQGDDFFRIEELFFMDGDTEMNREADPLESSIAFKSLEFENGKADILPTMHQDLDKLANFMIDHPKFKLNISGHTDSQGKEESNLRLSQARADAIKAYLIYQFKIEAARIDAHGYGSSKPIVGEETDEDRKLNRRVEFVITRD